MPRGKLPGFTLLKMNVSFLTLILLSLSSFDFVFSANNEPRSVLKAPPAESEVDMLDEREFKEACNKLACEIRNCAIQQLNLDTTHWLNLAEYEIENWPLFVSVHPKGWDRQAYKDLRAALPSMIFKEAQITTNSNTFAENNSKKAKEKLSEKILKIFQEQTGSKSTAVKYSFYNIVGWPVGIDRRVDTMTFPEILAVSRALDSIKILPIGENDQTRYIIYSDGSREDFPVTSRGKFPKLKSKFAYLNTENEKLASKFGKRELEQPQTNEISPKALKLSSNGNVSESESVTAASAPVASAPDAPALDPEFATLSNFEIPEGLNLSFDNECEFEF